MISAPGGVVLTSLKRENTREEALFFPKDIKRKETLGAYNLKLFTAIIIPCNVIS